MIFSIYNIQHQLDEDGFMFMDYAQMRELLHGEAFPSQLYQKVYSGCIEDLNDLEDVYLRFNSSEIPESFCGHSLSVSDLVVVHAGAQEEPGCYYCDTWGFRSVPDFDPQLARDEVRKIRVVRLRSGELAEPAEIPATLESYQREVGGIIDIMRPFADKNTGLVVNDEGKIRGMPLNRATFHPETGKIDDIIAGDCFVCDLSQDFIDGLDEERVALYTKEYLYPEHFILLDDVIHNLPYDPVPREMEDISFER